MDGRTSQRKKERKKERPLLSKIMIPMIIIVFLQMITFGGILVFNNGFSYLKRDAYEMIYERTENRKNYVENMLTQKTSLVYETAKELQTVTETVLNEREASIGALETDPELNKQIVTASVDKLISLLRRNMVNDAFLILDSGELYDSGGKQYRTGIYLRDTDVNENSTTDNSDIFMEMGSSQIAREYGMALDSGWSLYLDVTDQSSESNAFYYRPITTYEGNEKTPLYNLGYWSGLSAIFDTQQESVKYTLPLVSEDGTVYGVLGIGLLKKQIQQSMPSKDFSSESACYILGLDQGSTGVYKPMLYNGAAYRRLVSKSTVLNENRLIEYNLNDFTAEEVGSPECVGNVQRLNLYTSGSPYRNEQWALISVVDHKMALDMYYALLRTLLLSMSLTIVICVIVSVIIGRTITHPVTRLVNLLDTGVEESEQIGVVSSGISEIDSLARAVVELKKESREYALRVSKIITMSGNRMGVFLYNCVSGRVFVGENIGELFPVTLERDSDGYISEQEFWTDFIDKIDKQKKIRSLTVFEAVEDADSYISDSVEIKFIDADNAVRYFKFYLTRYHDNVFGMLQDTTQTVAEKQQIALGKDAEYTEKLEEAYDVLRDAYASANRANQAKTDFLSHMSHDIRTPMNAIIGMTMIARNNMDNPEKIEDCLKKITTSSEYLLALINEVLDMSKIEAGKLVLAEEKINLLELTDKLLELVSPSIKEKNHTLKVQISQLQHENVIGDSLRIQQVFMNIMSNAIKYTPPGGVIEFVLWEKPVGQDRIGCYEFVFRDNGNGMSEDFLERFFEPFEREDDARVNEQQGTGLGMAITHNIVKMMGGDIQVESELNKGSTFTVTLYLPFSEADKAPEEQAPLQTIIHNSKSYRQELRVLLVDDNELNREIASEILSMAGLKVDLAVDGKDALQKFEASAPGTYRMIFMDVQMPVMNGYEATRAIRALDREDADEIPIVAMTANAFAEDVRAAKESGMNEHIAKPIDLDRLKSVLDEFMLL